MASNKDPSIPTDNKASIALLCRLRAGEHVDFVHHVDVCAASPELLVADLEPVPGTGLEDDGYSRVWYLYHAKKFTNTRGELSGHRQRKVTGGATWHSERTKDVQGSDGGTFCSLSYGRKTEPSAKSIDRMGWCMVEYDYVAAGKKQDEAATADDSSNYVLCKVYRSPRAKEKSASASSSRKKQTMAKKRKAGGGDYHPEAPPAKSIQVQEPQVQHDIAYNPMPNYQYQQQAEEVAVQQAADPGGDFNFNIEDINFVYVDDESMLLQDKPEPEQGLHQQQPISEPKKHDVEFIQLMPCGPAVPVLAEATLEDMLALGPGPGPETMHNYGDWIGGMATARIPWSSYAYAPTSSSYTACSSHLQGPDPLQQLPPYLTC